MEIEINKGDYVKITKISCYGGYINYIAIVKEYDHENSILREIISCPYPNDNIQILFYDSVTENIFKIESANDTEKEYLSNLMKEMDNSYFDSTDLIIKNYD